MRISDNEVKKILSHNGEGTENGLVNLIDKIGQEADAKPDKEFVQAVVKDVQNMPDREDMIAELRARIEGGTYNPTSDEIVDAMVRRAIADQVR